MGAGEKVVIIGPSGSGKSTLLRTINRLEDISAGNIVVDGYNLDDKTVDINKVRMEVGMSASKSGHDHGQGEIEQRQGREPLPAEV